MRARRIAAMALAGGLVVGGAGGAIAAISADEGKQAEQSILDDAAKRLNVTPKALRDALAAAQDDQLDELVKDGELTRRQADEIRARRKQSGHVLGPPPGGKPHLSFHVGGPFLAKPGVGPALLDDVAKALGIGTEALLEQLRDGKTIAQIAKSEGTSLDDVRAAVKTAAKARADKAVADGDLTRAQADRMLAGLDEALEDLDKAVPVLGRPHLRFHGGGPLVGGPLLGPALLDDVAKALGIGTEALLEQLRDGKSLARIAKSEGTSVDDVRAAVKAAARARADKAVADGDLTRRQADRMLARLDEVLRHLGDARPFMGHRRFRHGAAPLPLPPGAPHVRPGEFVEPPLPLPPGVPS